MQFFVRYGLLVSLMGLAACQQTTTYGPQVTQDEIAAEKAKEDKAIALAKANGGVPTLWRRKEGMHAQFERVADRIEESGAQLCREMGLPAKKRSCYYYFELSRSRSINAHADGKNVVINSGMMHFVANDDELAAIIGHEMAHNLMDHRGSKTADALVGAVLGGTVDALSGSRNGEFMRAGAEMAAVSFSPEFEREADYVGLYIAARAGYNIHRAPDFWRRFSVQEPDSENGGITHPSNPERFVAMKKTIDEIDYKRKHGVKLLPDLKKDVTNSM